MRHGNRLPGGMVDVSSLETFKAKLDKVLNNLIQLWISLLVARELDWMAFRGPFQFYEFCGSWFHDRYSFWKACFLGKFQWEVWCTAQHLDWYTTISPTIFCPKKQTDDIRQVTSVTYMLLSIQTHICSHLLFLGLTSFLMFYY